MRKFLCVGLPFAMLLGAMSLGSVGCGDGDLCQILSEVAGTDLCDGDFGDGEDDGDDGFDDDDFDDEDDLDDEGDDIDDFDDFDDFDDE